MKFQNSPANEKISSLAHTRKFRVVPSFFKFYLGRPVLEWFLPLLKGPSQDLQNLARYVGMVPCLL